MHFVPALLSNVPFQSRRAHWSLEHLTCIHLKNEKAKYTLLNTFAKLNAKLFLQLSTFGTECNETIKEFCEAV